MIYIFFLSFHFTSLHFTSVEKAWELKTTLSPDDTVIDFFNYSLSSYTQMAQTRENVQKTLSDFFAWSLFLLFLK